MPTVRMRTLLWVGLVCVSALPAAGQQPAAEQRPYRVDDYFSTETILDASLMVAPDGQPW